MTKQQARLRVRLYARLSKDDGDADKESNSITNQLQMLRYYSKEKGFEIIDEYVDDGYVNARHLAVDALYFILRLQTYTPFPKWS